MPKQRLVWHHERLSAWKVCDIPVFWFSSKIGIHNHSQFERVACSQQPNTQFQHCYLISSLCRTAQNTNIPRLCCVLAMTVSHLFFWYSFKGLHNWPILDFCKCFTSGIKVLSFNSSSHSLYSPASPCMLVKVSSGLGISVKVTTDHMAIALPLAVSSAALKYMNMAVLDVLDLRFQFEENINWWVPVFWKLF